MVPNVNVEIVSGLAGLQNLREAWISLEATSDRSAFYTDWRWQIAVATHLGLRGLHYLCLSRGETLVGVLPLQVTRLRRGILSLPAVTFPRHNHITLSDILLSETEKAGDLVSKATEHLAGSAKFPWLCMHFHGVASGTQFLNAFPIDGLEVDWYGDSAFFDTKGKFVNGITRKLSRNILRLRQKAKVKYGDVRMTTTLHVSELIEAYHAFLTVEGSGWKDRKGTAIRNDSALIEFYEDLLRSFSTTRDAKINLLWFGNRVVAGKLCLRAGRVWSILKTGYDESFREFGPGSMLLKEILDQACSDPEVDEINMVTSPLWIQHWHPDSRKVYRVSGYRTSLLGQFVKMTTKIYQANRLP